MEPHTTETKRGRAVGVFRLSLDSVGHALTYGSVYASDRGRSKIQAHPFVSVSCMRHALPSPKPKAANKALPPLGVCIRLLRCSVGGVDSVLSAILFPVSQGGPGLWEQQH